MAGDSEDKQWVSRMPCIMMRSGWIWSAFIARSKSPRRMYACVLFRALVCAPPSCYPGWYFIIGPNAARPARPVHADDRRVRFPVIDQTLSGQGKEKQAPTQGSAGMDGPLLPCHGFRLGLLPMHPGPY